MADDPSPKKVVKRVVKRPVAPREQPAKPQMRYGRPVSESQKTPVAKVGAAKSGPTKVAARDEPAPAPPTSPLGPKTATKAKSGPAIKRPSVKAPNVSIGPVLQSIRTRTGSTAKAVGGRLGSAGRATGGFAADRWAAARAWRMPQLEPIRASALTGVIVGLISVGLGVAALALFTEVRGVANGGGLWGSLTFVAIAVLAVVLGERLLVGFGAPMPRATSVVGVLLAIIVILGVLLEPAGTRYGIIIIPVLLGACLAVSHWVLQLAESSPVDDA
jgi:hypothetical protein